MDTLEINYEGNIFDQKVPVVWRNRSPQDLYRDRYSECVMDKLVSGPKSLSHQAQNCDAYAVREKAEVKGTGRLKAYLVSIPEKP